MDWNNDYDAPGDFDWDERDLWYGDDEDDYTDYFDPRDEYYD